MGWSRLLNSVLLVAMLFQYYASIAAEAPGFICSDIDDAFSVDADSFLSKWEGLLIDSMTFSSSTSEDGTRLFWNSYAGKLPLLIKGESESTLLSEEVFLNDFGDLPVKVSVCKLTAVPFHLQVLSVFFSYSGLRLLID
jgi:hypothetical protein